MKTQVVSIRLDKTTYDRLIAMAAADNRKPGWIAARLLERALSPGEGGPAVKAAGRAGWPCPWNEL